ncbi:uncharacterized protein EI97DRAFT_439933 [Westerdykella ornata]|uniref:Uncharacterized protein n=1 Tax=Westerdykella ornata TaxID=318751 RepID=A0A6A6JTQ0_WESOR|nr:uncharacterized protein EI97DRAFT_439933 [Westerdykella ornata]KAF2279614.1 hypothetical protein EI97DRAFT_439933 [Westerdykella ornata]
MDPITILGLASNIISIIDCGVRLVSASKAIRESAHGASRSAQDLEAFVREARALSDDVFSMERSCGKRLSASEKMMLELAEECQDVIKEVETWVRKLTVTKGPSNVWKSMKVAGLELAKKDEIDRLKARLEALGSRFRDCVQQVLYQDRHLEILTRLRELEAFQKVHRMESSSTLKSIREDILRLLQPPETNADEDHKLQRALGVSQLVSLQSKLKVLAGEQQIYEKQRKILESLHFHDFKHRHSQIADAGTSTNAWLFDPRKTSFVKWLETGGGFFLISGKAGSGKSTLMKFAAEHDTTTDLLEKWASPQHLYTASYYFWNAGAPMEKSQVGLLQSLLYQIFRGSASLPSEISLCRRYHERWDTKELKELFSRVMERRSLSAKYCFFIDGLDEFEGDEEEVVDILRFISFSSHVKICASSRPRYIIEESLAVAEHMIIIHEHTKEDIKSWIHQKFSENPKFHAHSKHDPSYWRLVKMISSAAEGVWLWVYLVVRDLLHAVNRYESLPKLLEIVEAFPNNLDQYFESMLVNMRDAYKKEMARLFLLALNSDTGSWITFPSWMPLPLAAVDCVQREMSDPNYFSSKVSSMQMDMSVNVWKTRLHSRCRDLLVVENHPQGCTGAPPESPSPLNLHIVFLHRTVRDFLRDNFYTVLERSAGSDFFCVISTLKMWLFMCKIIVRPAASTVTEWWIREEWDLMGHHILDCLESLPEGWLEDTNSYIELITEAEHTLMKVSGCYEQGASLPIGPIFNLVLRHSQQYPFPDYLHLRLQADPGLISRHPLPLLTYTLPAEDVTSGTLGVVETLLKSLSRNGCHPCSSTLLRYLRSYQLLSR